MQYLVEKKYLVLPVNRTAKKKNLAFYNADGVCVFDLDVRLDYIDPAYDAYVDMARFVGDTLDVRVEPEMRLVLKQKERMPVCRFREGCRPRYHFTAPEGWLGAPNGLVYTAGKYQLFYQTDPVGTERGNLHWGHAASRNLVDWEYDPLALFPDAEGAMLSGSAVLDEKNLLGMKNSEKTPVVLFYTAAGDVSRASKGKPFAQYVAVSCDGCETFSKLPQEPVVGHLEANNRDPKAVYSTRYDIYVLSLYLENDRYAIFTSKDLKNWNKIQEIALPGDGECPAFFPLVVDEAEEKWVFAGARGRYFAGEFDGTAFTPDSDEPKTLQYGEDACAAGRFENAPDGRCIRVGRLRGDFSACRAPFDGALTFPQEMTLVHGENGLTLRVSPVAEIKKLQGRRVKETLSGTEARVRLPGIAQDVTLEIDPKEANGMSLFLFGETLLFDFETRLFGMGQTKAPLVPCESGKYRVRILTDTCGFEVFLGDGAAYAAYGTHPDENLDMLVLRADAQVSVKLDAYRLRDAKRVDCRK